MALGGSGGRGMLCAWRRGTREDWTTGSSWWRGAARKEEMIDRRSCGWGRRARAESNDGARLEAMVVGETDLALLCSRRLTSLWRVWMASFVNGCTGGRYGLM